MNTNVLGGILNGESFPELFRFLHPDPLDSKSLIYDGYDLMKVFLKRKSKITPPWGAEWMCGYQA